MTRSLNILNILGGIATAVAIATFALASNYPGTKAIPAAFWLAVCVLFLVVLVNGISDLAGKSKYVNRRTEILRGISSIAAIPSVVAVMVMLVS